MPTPAGGRNGGKCQVTVHEALLSSTEELRQRVKDHQNLLKRAMKRGDAEVRIDEAIAIADRVIVLSDRPGQIIKEYTVELPRPRDRISRKFTDLFVELHQSLSSDNMECDRHL